MNRLVIALFLFLVVPFFAFGQCPIPEDTLTDKFGNTWKGKISGESVWPTIKIDEPGRGRYGANFNELTKLVWEGVTNAKECYYDNGIKAWNEAGALFSRGNTNPTNPNPALLAQSRDKYQEAIDYLSKVKPQAEDLPKYKNLYLHQQAQKHIVAAGKMVPKLNSALHFNDGFSQFQEALSITDHNEIATARSLLAESKANFGTAIEDFNKAILEGATGKEELAKKVIQARTLQTAGDQISNWLEGTSKLFSPQDLKNAETFTLNNLIDGIQTDSRNWNRLNDEVMVKILDGRLEWIQGKHAERSEEAESIIIFREDLGRVEQECKILLAGIPNKIDQEDYEGADADVTSVFGKLDRIAEEVEFSNASEQGRIQDLRDLAECYRKEIDFADRRISATRELLRGSKSEQNHEQTTAAKEEFLDLINDAENIEALCADKAWVAATIEDAEKQLVAVSNVMERQDWILKDGEYLAPIHKNFQAMLNTYTAGDLTSTNLKQATYFHGKILSILDAEKNQNLTEDERASQGKYNPTTEDKEANANYLLQYGKMFREQKKYDEAQSKFGLIKTHYGDTSHASSAAKETWIAWALKNLVALCIIGGLLLLTFLFLFFRRFSPKVIESKQRNKLLAIEENRKMKPEKKVKAFAPIIGKLEKLEKKRKLTKNGKAYAKKAHVDRGVSLLRLGKKEGADKAFERAEHFQRVEPEEILPALAIFHLKQGDTDEGAMEVYAEYLNLPEQHVNERLESDIQNLVSNAEINTYEEPPPPPDGGRFVTSEIDIDGPPPPPGGSAPPPPPGGSAPPTPPEAAAAPPKAKKKSIRKKTVIIKKKK